MSYSDIITEISKVPKDTCKHKVIDGITFEITTLQEIPGSIWMLVRENGRQTWGTSYNFGDSPITNISIKKIISKSGEADAWCYVRMANGDNWKCKIEPEIQHVECLSRYPTYTL